MGVPDVGNDDTGGASGLRLDDDHGKAKVNVHQETPATSADAPLEGGVSADAGVPHVDNDDAELLRPKHERHWTNV